MPQDDKKIYVYDSSIVDSTLYVRQGSTVIWENKSASQFSIYSGATTYEEFTADPDLTLYGDDFESGIIDTNETYSLRFDNMGEYDWFVYPSILTGKVIVTDYRLSGFDKYYILENDGLESPFTSRLIKVNSFGNVLWSFGEGYLIKPRDIRSLLTGQIIIST
jgi:plastocyanin